MDLLKITLASLASIVVLFILAKLIGNRQMSQLSMFDYINGITIGSIAAELAISTDDFLQPLISMVIYGVVTAFISYITCKSVVLRRFVTGKALILFENGKLYEGNLKKARLDVNEFLEQCRNSGYFDISKLHTAILEANGKISFLPLSTERPLTPNDLSQTPPADTPCVNLIIDGKVMEDNLKFTGNDIKWLKKQLHTYDITKIDEVFLATCDYDNNVNVYKKIEKTMTRDLFE